MSLTLRQLLRGALRLIGAVSSGENVPANEMQDAHQAFNAMLESWSLERLLIWHIPRVEVPLMASQQTYTWGPGGQINRARPFRLENALLNLGPASGGSGPLEWPVRIWTQDEYESWIWLKELGSTYLFGVYLATTFPLATLHVWPVPTDTTTTLVVFPWEQLTAVPDLDTLLTFPPGYERALRYGFATEMAPEYGLEVPQTVLQVFAEAKSNIKRINVVVPTLAQPVHSAYDSPGGYGASRYDIRRG